MKGATSLEGDNKQSGQGDVSSAVSSMENCPHVTYSRRKRQSMHSKPWSMTISYGRKRPQWDHRAGQRKQWRWVCEARLLHFIT